MTDIAALEHASIQTRVALPGVMHGLGCHSIVPWISWTQAEEFDVELDMTRADPTDHPFPAIECINHDIMSLGQLCPTAV